MVDVFITGTFRNEWNKEFNEKVASLLAQNKISFYLPQRDTEQSGNRRKTFQENVAGIRSSRILLAIGTRTQTANWGFEIGLAFSLLKPIVVVTDTKHPVELMCEGAASSIILAKDIDSFESFSDKIVDELRKHGI